jgi:hypothetical protein
MINTLKLQWYGSLYISPMLGGLAVLLAPMLGGLAALLAGLALAGLSCGLSALGCLAVFFTTKLRT